MTKEEALADLTRRLRDMGRDSSDEAANLIEHQASELEARDRAIAEADQIAKLNDFEPESSLRVQFAPFLPKPDKLAECVKAVGYATLDSIEAEFAADLRAAIIAAGGRDPFEGREA